MGTRGLRIAFFSDTTGEHSLSAHCGRILLPLLASEHSIEAFSDSFAAETGCVPQHHYLKAYQRHREDPFDLFFYQLEDGRRSRFVRASIGVMPGVTWFHDLFFQDLGPEATHTSPWENSIRQFYRPNLPFADRSVAPHQLWPRAFRELSLSPVNLFSSRWLLAESKTMISSRLEAEIGAHRSELLNIPVQAVSPAPMPSKETLRVAALSGSGLEGRAHKLLGALRGLKHPWHLTWVVEPNEATGAEALLREFEAGERTTIVPSCSPSSWSDILAGSHVALHLRTSCFGHLAPYVQLSLASGRLTVVSDMGQGEDMPDAVACRVTPGISEGTQLAAILERACEIDILHTTSGARKYVASEHSPNLVAQCLSSLLIAAAPLLKEPMRRWDGLYGRAKSELLREVESLMGASQDAGLSPFARIMDPAVTELFGR